MSQQDRILVIDDELNLRRTLALILQRAGYQVDTAGNSREIQHCLDHQAYDLVFLDLQMPDIHGLEVLPTIQRLYPGLPVIILTAHATIDSAIESVRKGARDYLLKPIDPAQILRLVCEVISERQQNRRRQEILLGVEGLIYELHQLDGPAPYQPPTPQKISSMNPARFLQRGAIVLDMLTRQVVFENRTISLAPTAFDYLTTLVRHAPHTVSHETLVAESQGYHSSLVEALEIARWRIHELRKAIEENPRRPIYIITVRGEGYRLVT